MQQRPGGKVARIRWLNHGEEAGNAREGTGNGSLAEFGGATVLLLQSELHENYGVAGQAGVL